MLVLSQHTTKHYLLNQQNNIQKIKSQKLTKHLQMLQQKSRLAQLGLAVAKINHDLRNMLATAQLMSDRLAALPDPAVQKLSPKLIASLDRAIEFCNETLKFGQAEEAQPRRQRFALLPLVEEVGDGLGLPSEQIAWVVAIPSDLAVHADRGQLFRILNNLARNACQALDAVSGRRREIRITASQLDGSVRIEVADNGPGVPERALANLFQPFKGGVRKGGSGLGLAIASELVAAHGGHLRHTAADPGAIFIFELAGPVDGQATPPANA